MAHSMTAFARRECPVGSATLSCELKTVNHRYLDVSLRAPLPLRSLEPVIVKRIRTKLARGRVECGFVIQGDDAEAMSQANMETLVVLAGEMRKVEDKLHSLGMDLTPVSVLDVMKQSGIMSADGDDDQLREAAMRLLDEVLDDLIQSRQEEGERLQQFILENSSALEKTVLQLRKHYPKALAAAREKLNQRLAEMDVEIEPERLAQEATLLAQKFYINADIEEELDRCDSHIQELKAIFKRKEPIGRRLDFLMQELNREANTISSKSADIKTTHTAVEAKTLIEQMREQIQNIE